MLPDPATIACYCRVSTRTQKNDSQRAAFCRSLRSHGIDASDVQWFTDHKTGKTTRREGFQQIQQTVFDGTVKTVIVWKLDRLSRRQRDGINLLADWSDRGVRVISVTQQIDLSGPIGRMVASVMFGLAEIELEYRRERQAAGIEVAKQRGVYRGRAHGTTKSKPDRAQELLARGLTVVEIAAALDTSERTVFRDLALANDSRSLIPHQFTDREHANSSHQQARFWKSRFFWKFAPTPFPDR